MEPLHVMKEGERGVKMLGRPARDSYRLLRYRCAKVLLYRRKSTAMEFSKKKSEMRGRRERGFAHSNDRGNSVMYPTDF